MPRKDLIITDKQEEFLKKYKKRTRTTGNECMRKALDKFIKIVEAVWKRELKYNMKIRKDAEKWADSMEVE